MNSEPAVPFAVLLLVAVPLVATWLFVVVDVFRQRSLSLLRKLLWIAACTLLWPAMIVYLLVRRQHGRASQVADRSDPHARLVHAVSDHEAGRIDDAAFAATVQRLRTHQSSNGSVHRGGSSATGSGRVP